MQTPGATVETSNQAIATAVATILAFAIGLPSLLKGKWVVLRREYDLQAREAKRHFELAQAEAGKREAAAAKHHAEVVAQLVGERDRLQAENVQQQAELREQYRVNADLARDVYQTVRWLQSLSGLAQADRRAPGREGS